MAKFEMELPQELIKDFNKIYDNSEEIFGGMTQAGAKVVESAVIANLPPSLRKGNFSSTVGITQVYRTPSDGGINTKVGIWGYFENENGQTVPAPLVANAFEYGTSERHTALGYNRGQITKQPFFRKSFSKAKIEKAMLAEQKRLSGGLLDE